MSKFIEINGKHYPFLGLRYFNQLLADKGLPPIIPMSGETVQEFKQRAEQARREFMVTYGHLFEKA